MLEIVNWAVVTTHLLEGPLGKTQILHVTFVSQSLCVFEISKAFYVTQKDSKTV